MVQEAYLIDHWKNCNDHICIKSRATEATEHLEKQLIIRNNNIFSTS